MIEKNAERTMRKHEQCIEEKLTGWDGGNRCCAAAELRAAASRWKCDARENRAREKQASKEATSQRHEDVAAWGIQSMRA